MEDEAVGRPVMNNEDEVAPIRELHSLKCRYKAQSVYEDLKKGLLVVGHLGTHRPTCLGGPRILRVQSSVQDLQGDQAAL